MVLKIIGGGNKLRTWNICLYIYGHNNVQQHPKRVLNYHIPTLAVANDVTAMARWQVSNSCSYVYCLPGVLINSLRKQLYQFNVVTQHFHPPGCDVDVTQYTASLLECDSWSTLFGVLLNKSLYCMFPDPFLLHVAVTVGKGLAMRD